MHICVVNVVFDVVVKLESICFPRRQKSLFPLIPIGCLVTWCQHPNRTFGNAFAGPPTRRGHRNLVREWRMMRRSIGRDAKLRHVLQ
jgi:hypothetical protein